MSWTVVAGKSPVQNAGAVVTIATITNDGTGKSFDTEIRYDGTLAGLQAACAALVLKVDGQSKPVFVVPGTSFSIPDSVAVVDPRPAAFLAWQAKWNTYLQLSRWLATDIPSVTQARVDQAKADHEKAWDVSFEAFL